MPEVLYGVLNDDAWHAVAEGAYICSTSRLRAAEACDRAATPKINAATFDILKRLVGFGNLHGHHSSYAVVYAVLYNLGRFSGLV